MSNDNETYAPIIRQPGGGPIATVPTERPYSVLPQAIWRRKWSFLIVLALALAAGVGYLVLKTPGYSGVARIYVRQDYPRLLSEPSGVMRDSRNYLFTEAELMRSAPVLDLALARPEVAESATLADVTEPKKHLQNIIDAEVGLKDDIINLTCLSPVPHEAAVIANAVADAYVAYHGDLGRASAGTLLNILQREKTEKDQELTTLLEDMVHFKQTNRTLSFQSDRGNIAFQRLARIADGLADGQMELINARTDYEAVRAAMDDPAALKRLMEAGQLSSIWQTSKPADDQERVLRAQLDQLELELVARRQESTDRSPAVAVLLQKIETLNRQIDQRQQEFAQACLTAAEQRWLAFQDKQDKLQEAFDEQRQVAEELNVQAAQYAVLESQLRRTERACDMLDGRIKELNLAEDAGGLNITLLEQAQTPTEPAEPNRAQVMAMSGAIGLVLALGWVLIGDWRDEKLRSTEEVSGMLGTRVLGALPSKGWGKRLNGKAGRNVLLEPRSHTAEACRRIRTALLCGNLNGSAKTLLVTSPQRGDGKSTLVGNLAIMMAMAGRRTLVLDADLRRPTQHRLFRVSRYSGLTDVLLGKAKAPDLIRHTAVERLDILPCGPVATNPSELLHSPAMDETLKELSMAYDYIFVDSPCVLSLADAQILSARCDMTLLVLRADKTTRKSAQLAQDNLLSVGGRLLGVVVNAVPRRDGYYMEPKYDSGRSGGGNGSDRHGGNGGVFIAEPARTAAPTNLTVDRGFFNGVWRGITAPLRRKPIGPSAT